MRKSISFLVMSFIVAGLMAQYVGEPWNGEPWAFTTTNSTNFTVGSSITSGTYTYAGVPHWAYDIGEVNLEIRCSADTEGEFVAGNGTGKTGTGGQDRRAEIGTAKTFTASDIAARADEGLSHAVLRSNPGEHRFQTGGAWVRYTCTFDEGNYKLLFLGKTNANGNFNFWVRFYNTDMEPLYPWGRYHAGVKDTTAQYQTTIVDVLTGDYTALTTPHANMFWVSLNDEFTLDGDVIVEISDPEPVSGAGSSGAGSPFGGFTFEYVAPAADKYAPQFRTDGTDLPSKIDDLDTLKMTITEAGTLYIVPKGTASGDVETSALMSQALDANAAWEVPKLSISADSIEVWSKDAAGNMRSSIPVAVVDMVSYIPRNDSLLITSTRNGTAYLVPSGTGISIAEFDAAVAGGTADSIHVTNNAEKGLKIESLADGLYMVYAVDTANGGLSQPAYVTIVGGNPSSAHDVELSHVRVYPTLVTDILNISSDEQVAQIQIYNTVGAVVYQQSNPSTSVNCSALANGFYFVTIRTTSDSFHSFKICKQ